MAIVVGDTFAREIEIDAASIKAFATLAGDQSELHHDEEKAKKSPFGALIASGTHSSSLMIGTLATCISERGRALGLSHAMKFRRAIKADTHWRVVWTVTSTHHSEKLGGTIVSCEGRLIGSGGEIAVEATAETLLYG